MTFKEHFKASIYLIYDYRTASKPMIQRSLGIGYFRATALIEELERYGFISKSMHGQRQLMLENIAKAEQKYRELERSGIEILDRNVYILTLDRSNLKGHDRIEELLHIYKDICKLEEFESYRLIMELPDKEETEVRVGTYEELEPMLNYLVERRYIAKLRWK